MRDQPSRLILAAAMVALGSLHFIATDGYSRIVPHFLPRPRLWVYASGVAEIACGILLAIPRTKKAGAWGVVALLVAVFPANIQMALDGGVKGTSFPMNSPAAAWLRLPLQLPLIAWAYRFTRDNPLTHRKPSVQ